MTSESILDFVVDTLLGLTAFVCTLGMVTVLIVVYLIVRPFSVGIARRLSNHIGASSFLDALALLLPNTRIYLTGDSDVPSPVGTSILVSNHLMDGDWFTILMLGRCVGLRGSVKMFLRNEILHLNTKAPRGRSSTSSPSPSSSSPTNTARNGGLTNSASSGVIESTPSPQRANGSSSTATGNTGYRHPTSPDLSMAAAFLHAILEFPLLNGEDYISDRESLFQLLRSFADRNGAEAPVHLLLYPEGWSLYNGENRKTVLARSNEFAKREGRPQLKHLLLPRTTGFNASLESLRESSPVVYDVTMAYRGYDGRLPPKFDLSLVTLWNILRRKYPEEMHLRVKRYSMEEVLSDASWLDKKWAEKDRLLNHFSRHQMFPADSRGFCRHRVFDTRFHSMETSIISLVRLLLLPFAVPVLVFLSIPIFCGVLWAWVVYTSFKILFGGPSMAQPNHGTTENHNEAETISRGGSNAGTPFCPATPFASPSITNWRDMLMNRNYDNQKT